MNQLPTCRAASNAASGAACCCGREADSGPTCPCCAKSRRSCCAAPVASSDHAKRAVGKSRGVQLDCSCTARPPVPAVPEEQARIDLRLSTLALVDRLAEINPLTFERPDVPSIFSRIGFSPGPTLCVVLCRWLV